jgi:hypothetical protein
VQAERQSVAWRLFALLAAFALLGFHSSYWIALITHPTPFGIGSAIVSVLAAVGILGYAFGFRVGPIVF